MIREQRFINDDWTFAYGEHPGAEGEPPSPDWYDVGLPHSFDLPDFREQRFYVGHGCYRRAVEVPPEWLGKWIALEFLGVFQIAEVYVNGRFVARHEGGYTPFTVDLSHVVNAGANDVFVRVDNIWNPRLAPRAGDFSFNGGIYRDVSLIVADKVRIDWYGIGVTTPQVDRERAEVNATVAIVNDEPHAVEVRVAGVIGDTSRPVARLEPVRRTVPAGATIEVELEGQIIQPRLWHPDHPHRYRLTASVTVDGQVRDTQATAFGARWYEFTADRGFFLNGERLDLHGANVHQNRGGWGDAGTRASIRRDVAMIKELGMNLIRGSHYPHHPYFAEECDRQGLLFWSELHFWGIGGEDVEGYWFASAYPIDEADEPEFEESLRRALREMIRTHRNHPSIITWSIGNEAFFSDDRVIGKAKALTTELVDLSHELDPTRPAAVGGAQRKGFDVLGDIAGYNGDGAELYLDPGIPSVVSEYHGVQGQGAGEYEVVWEHGVEVDYPWRSGKILWCAFHYKTIADGAGLQGLADYWRMPKRAYYWYREKLRGLAPPAFAEPGTAVALRLTSDAEMIPTDGTGDARLLVELVDEHGVRVVDDRAVRLTVVEGEGVFPSGRSITLSPENHSLRDGAGAMELRAYVPGTQRIRATADGLGAAELVLMAVGPRNEPRVRRLPPPAPSVTEPPTGQGEASLAAYRPVAVSSAEPLHGGGNATVTGSGAFWRAAGRDPGEWLAADLEFPYEISRVEVVFAEPPAHQWTVETSVDGRAFELLHRGEPETKARSASLQFPARTARRVRLSFPEKPIDVEEIRVY
ncbi:glycoside hydrolase family 2 protein [Glycomyces buryatensis]|nr:glycoside hydrolase family 2 TIM barrel-domain containing protein [Glycomyces buryatensis]